MLASGHVQLPPVPVTIFFTPHQQQDGFGAAFRTLIDSSTALKTEVRGYCGTPPWSVLGPFPALLVLCLLGVSVCNALLCLLLVELPGFVHAMSQFEDAVLLLTCEAPNFMAFPS